MIRQIQSEVDKPFLLLDGGALLFDQPSIPPSLLPARMIQAGGISQAMQAMKYGAIGIAAQDLAGGLEFLLRQGREHGLTLLSANLVDRAGKKPLKPSIATRVGETPVAVIGLTGEPAGKKPGPASEDYRLLPWQEVLPEAIKQARGAEMIILLSSYPEPVNQEIASRFPDIHLVIQSGTFSANKAPHLVGNTLLTQVAAKGKYLGRLDIDWKASRRWAQAQEGTPRLQQARDNLDRIKWRLGRLEKRLPDKERLAQNSEYQQLRQEQDRLTAEIARLDQPAQEDNQEGLATFTSNFIPLKISLPEDPEVQKIVQQTKQDINRSGQKKSGEEAAGKAPRDRGMTGWRACQACHPEQVAFWQGTRHAGAWQTLVRERQQANQDCVLCHVTLPTYDLQTVHQENLLASLTEDFQGVGCEVCHGPGGRHVASPGQARPLSPTEKTCRTCHTPEHDNNFIYEKKLPLIRCPASAPNSKGAA